MDGMKRLSAFLGEINKDIYAELPAEPHVSITAQTIPHLFSLGYVKQGDRVLDVGCGQGQALQLFAELGAEPTGVTFGEDAVICRQKGLDIAEMDLSFLDFADASFDYIWCRHSLEHSIFPLFTLAEFFRLLGPNGGVYVEVPASETACRHEQNPNHYSVLGKTMWLSLFQKAGLELVGTNELKFTAPIGEDVYWVFLLKKPDLQTSGSPPAR